MQNIFCNNAKYIFLSIRTVVNSGKICVLNLQPCSLPNIHESDLKPYVVFLTPSSPQVPSYVKIYSQRFIYFILDCQTTSQQAWSIVQGMYSKSQSICNTCFPGFLHQIFRKWRTHSKTVPDQFDQDLKEKTLETSDANCLTSTVILSFKDIPSCYCKLL